MCYVLAATVTLHPEILLFAGISAGSAATRAPGERIAERLRADRHDICARLHQVAGMTSVLDPTHPDHRDADSRGSPAVQACTAAADPLA
jgi:hypothetical protein